MVDEMCFFSRLFRCLKSWSKLRPGSPKLVRNSGAPLDDYKSFLKKWWFINQQIKKIVVSFCSLCQKFSFLRRTQACRSKVSFIDILEH